MVGYIILGIFLGCVLLVSLSLLIEGRHKMYIKKDDGIGYYLIKHNVKVYWNDRIGIKMDMYGNVLQSTKTGEIVFVTNNVLSEDFKVKK